MYLYFTVSNPIIDGPPQVILHINPGTSDSRLANSRLAHSLMRLLWNYAKEGASFKIKREKK